jgi:hypothetical protein
MRVRDVKRASGRILCGQDSHEVLYGRAGAVRRRRSASARAAQRATVLLPPRTGKPFLNSEFPLDMGGGGAAQ